MSDKELDALIRSQDLRENPWVQTPISVQRAILKVSALKVIPNYWRDFKTTWLIHGSVEEYSIQTAESTLKRLMSARGTYRLYRAGRINHGDAQSFLTMYYETCMATAKHVEKSVDLWELPFLYRANLYDYLFLEDLGLIDFNRLEEGLAKEAIRSAKWVVQQPTGIPNHLLGRPISELPEIRQSLSKGIILRMDLDSIRQQAEQVKLAMRFDSGSIADYLIFKT